MKPVQRASLAALALIAGLVLFLALRTRQPPFLPRDEPHAQFVGAGPCLVCHGAEGPAPQSKNHPLGNDCTRCHGRPD